MAKLRIPMTLIATELTAKWMIDFEPEAWDLNSKEVEIEVNEFKRLASLADDKDELAQLIIEWVREEESKRGYNEFIDELIKNCWVE